MKTNQKPVVAGRFYPADSSQLRSEVKVYFENAASPVADEVMAVISPHAGYVFSGQIAADAINQIDRTKNYKAVFVIASSHTMHFAGASVYTAGNYETPLGEIEVNMSIANSLVENHEVFSFIAQVHATEHSLEVQLPLLQCHLNNNFTLVPIIIGTQDIDEIRQIANALEPYFTNDYAFVFSTDLSHYPSYSDAKKTDAATIEAICKGKSEDFLDAIAHHNKTKIRNLATGICGWSSVLSLLFIAENKDTQFHAISYTNSGDSPYGDTLRVVGYCAIAVEQVKADFSLSSNDKQELLIIARKTLESKIGGATGFRLPSDGISESLMAQCGVFVSLHKHGELRGCIGRFSADMPLYKLVSEMAIASALNDYRFSPVKASELNDIEIEISVLTPMQKISDTSEIVLGKHGIYIKSGNCAGTFLPQVAEQTGWSLEEFLGHCSRDKAGLGWEGWKKADVYVYEAIVFDESMLNQSSYSENKTLFYEKMPDKKVKCTLCPHYCVLAEGQTGLCQARINKGGEMKSLSYGKIAAIHIDPVEKKPLYHFMPGSQTLSVGTAGCNLHCKNCQNHHISQVSPETVEYVSASPEQIVQKAIESGCKSISYTYNEPTVFYEFMLETAMLAKENGLKNIIVSNGYITQEALHKLIPYIDAANIDLKCFNDSTYRQLTTASLEPVLRTLLALKTANVWLEITWLIIPGWTDNVKEIAEMCRWLMKNDFENTPLHFSRFFPAYKMNDVPSTEVAIVKKAVETAEKEGIRFVYAGNVHNEEVLTRCPECNATILSRKAYNTLITEKFAGNCPKCGAIIQGVW